MTRFLRLPEVIDRTGLKRSSIYLAIHNGTFPAQIPLGIRAVGWSEFDVNAWVDARIQAAAKLKNPAGS